MRITGTILWVGMAMLANAQSPLVKTDASPFVKMHSVGMQDVRWTQGFWAERFAVCRDVMVPQLWDTYTNETLCHSFKNFEIAAGLDTGRFRGPSFHDGDFYKTLESLAAMYAQTKDAKLDALMDQAIAVIAKAQKEDGYIYTKAIIEQRKSGQTKMFDDKLSFEAYNFGHLMTAACVHYRATGKRTLLDVAIKATDFLLNFYTKATPEQARNAICPSHYMGITEMYRTTKDTRYLDLVKKLIDIRGTTEGTDDNSDRAPFRDMQRIAGHAVRANYLMAGVADVFAENGDTSLLRTLNRLWENVILTKMYVTGGCGALYDGISTDGTTYKPDSVQKVHQSYGRDFQLPNQTAHNETCANIGNVLWNWRMFLLTGEVKYMDVVELSLYNSVLSGVSMDGSSYFYTNPLAASKDFPYHLRWEGGRKPYIKLSNCCPPNVVRTIAEVQNYVYTVADDGLYLNLYGGNSLQTVLKDGSALRWTQETNYPWSGKIRIKIEQAPAHIFSIHFRIPEWCKKGSIVINGKLAISSLQSGTYQKLARSFKKGDVIELDLHMPVTLLESNPLVEETRNQVTVKRGPIVYCMESPDLQENINVSSLAIPVNNTWVPFTTKIGQGNIIALKGTAVQIQQQAWKGSLYREVETSSRKVPVTLIPYYAWANRGNSDMRVWLPVIR